MRPARHLVPALALLVVAACSLPASPETGVIQSSQSTAAPPRSAIVQLFDWPFSDIEKEVPRLVAIGYSHIHVSPPTLSNPDTRWWARYQPVDYRVIDGPLGDEAAFRSMVTAANTAGIKIVVDIVFNHMANFGGAYDLTYPPSPAKTRELYGKTYPELEGREPLFSANDFHFPFCIANYGNAAEVRDGRICGGGGDTGLPDLKQLNEERTGVNPRVLERQRALLDRLVQMGVGGFRFDAIKHMEPAYFSALLAGLPKEFLIFGESISEPNRSSFTSSVEPYLQLGTPMKLYDFALVNTMRDAFRLGGNLGSLAGELHNEFRALYGPIAVTFVVNHDIPQNPMAHYYMGACGGTDRYGDPTNERLAYAFVLGRSHGTPYVYSDRGLAGADGVATDAYRNAHRGCDSVRMMRFHTLLLGEPEAVAHSSADQLVLQRGRRGFVAVNKSAGWWSAPDSARAELEDGTFIDVLSGHTLVASQGKLEPFAVGPRDAAMYVHASILTPAVAAELASLPCERPSQMPCP